MGAFVGMLACYVHVIYNQLIEDVIKDSKHYCIDGITTKKFPSVQTGEANVVIKLVQFNREISSDAVLDWFYFNKMRAANVHELLAVGEKYPHLQLDFNIVELGSIWYYRLHEPMCVKLTRKGISDHTSIGQIYMTDAGQRLWPITTLFAAVTDDSTDD